MNMVVNELRLLMDKAHYADGTKVFGDTVFVDDHTTFFDALVCLLVDGDE